MSDHRIRPFFDFFRKRQSVIEDLQIADDARDGFSPDQSVLYAACVDSLAMHWAAMYAPHHNAKGAPARRRLQEMLVTFADRDIFERVSGPDLRRRAGRDGKQDVAAAVGTLYEDEWDHTIWLWREDRVLAEVLAAPAVVATGIASKFVEQSRYGELLYREFRCSWLHELDGGDVSTRSYSEEPRHAEPHYENWMSRSEPFGTHRRLAFPRAFLMSTLERAIDGFEAACLRDGREPAVVTEAL